MKFEIRSKKKLGIKQKEIIAEIVHLPENRTGNVLRRPNLRLFEIPYMGQSSLPSSQQINIEDIMISKKMIRVLSR